jgi:hypothetical protein
MIDQPPVGVNVAQCRRFLHPNPRLGLVLRHAVAELIEYSYLPHGHAVTTIGSPLVPAHGFSIILHHALSELIEQSNIVHSARPMPSALAISVVPMPCAFISRTLAASIEAGGPCRRPRPWPWRCPQAGRSRRRLVSNSAKTPSISRKHLPAAVLVSIGCSVAFNDAPRALMARTMS